MRTRWIAALALCAALVTGTADASADAVLEWNVIMTEIVKDQPPPDMNRFAAITQLAVFEAVNSATGMYEPYLHEMAESTGASADAAAVVAAHAALFEYFPGRAAYLDAARARSLGRVPDGPAKSAGISIGKSAAARVIHVRANDGSEPPQYHLPSAMQPGEWQLTADCPPSGGFFLHWRDVRPFAIRHAAQFRSDPPPSLSGTRYARDYKEVSDVGGRDSSERPQDRVSVVKVYEASSDAILWNSIARQLAAAGRRSLAENARMFALLNMALNDAGISVLETKYHYNFWRPETAIARGGEDGNDRTDSDPQFEPFISAPCFPSYPSGHASTSYAARAVLERIFGGRGHRIRVSTSAVQDVTLRYSRLKDITSDIDDARIYGGIHFRFDQESGAEQGLQVGEYVYRSSLRPRGSSPCDASDGT